MLASWILGDAWLFLLLVGFVLCYWRLLGMDFDARMFIALNFALTTLWAFQSESSLLFRTASLGYIGLLVLSNRLKSRQRVARRMDSVLDADLSSTLVVVAVLALVSNLSSGYATLEDKSLLLERQAESSLSRYTNYLLLSVNWLSVHVINTAASQPRWSKRQILATVLATAVAVTGLSKASLLPILLTLLFVYSKRLGPVRMTVLLGASLGATLLLIQRLLQDLPEGVSEIFFSRILQNMDVVDYIDALGYDTASQYPHVSFFYLLWPFFQLTQTDFIVSGAWLHGTLVGDWRGYGPNSTFIMDQLIASNYVGLLLAPLFGIVLRASSSAKYRVFIAMACYSFLQDWYFSCVNLLVFGAILSGKKLLSRVEYRNARRIPTGQPDFSS
jgi:hypothetical protein